MLGQNSHTAIDHLQLIQRRCEKCDGSGLVERGPFLRKCPECGGFFPWQGWKQFLTSTAAPGNGGVLRQPRNQEGVIYRYHASLLQQCTWLASMTTGALHLAAGNCHKITYFECCHCSPAECGIGRPLSAWSGASVLC